MEGCEEMVVVEEQFKSWSLSSLSLVVAGGIASGSNASCSDRSVSVSIGSLDRATVDSNSTSRAAMNSLCPGTGGFSAFFVPSLRPTC